MMVFRVVNEVYRSVLTTLELSPTIVIYNRNMFTVQATGSSNPSNKITGPGGNVIKRSMTTFYDRV